MAVTVQEDVQFEASDAPGLREILWERWESSDEISTAELIAEIREQHGADMAFLAAFFDEYLVAVVNEILEHFARGSRQAFIRTPGGRVSREKLEENAKTRLAHVFEANGKGTYRSFLALRKRDLLDLNERDEKVIATRRNWVSFRSDLARRMNMKQTVAEVFSTSEIDAAWRKAFVTPDKPSQP
jgi:hypothetical protein